MIGNERRLSQAEFKQRAGELIKMFGRDGFDDLPLWRLRCWRHSRLATKTTSRSSFANRSTFSTRQTKWRSSRRPLMTQARRARRSDD